MKQPNKQSRERRYDSVEGMRLLRHLAEEGDVDARKDLADRLIKGNGCPFDRAEGMRWLCLLAEGDGRGEDDRMVEEARQKIADCLFGSRSRLADPKEGIRLLRQWAEKGDNWARRELEKRLLQRGAGPKNQARGIRLLRRWAEQGDGWAMGKLAQHLIAGIYCPADLVEGLRLLRQSAETVNDEWEAWNAHNIVINLLLDPDCEVADRQEGMRLLRQYAEKYQFEVLGRLIDQLLDGSGCEADHEEGMRLLRQSAEEGKKWAQEELAYRLLEGRGCEADREEGIRLLRLIAERDDDDDSVARHARWDLAEYLLGENTYPDDPEEEVELLRRFAELGMNWAQMDLADRLFEGRLCKANPEEAMRYLRLAAQADSPRGETLGYNWRAVSWKAGVVPPIPRKG